MVPRGRRGSARIAVLTIINVEFEAVSGVFNTKENIPGTPYFGQQVTTGLYQYDIIVRKAADRGNYAAGQALQKTTGSDLHI